MKKKFKVLVVDDDEFIRAGVKGVLEFERCEVETAPEGQTALERLKSAPQLPDLIFLDLNMPQMSGMEFLNCLSLEETSLAAIPIVVMTALPNVDVPGVAAVIRKPMEMDEIVGMLSAFRGSAGTRCGD